MKVLVINPRNTAIMLWRNNSPSDIEFNRLTQMATYIFFDDALRMLTNTYLISAVLLIAVSSIGLAVIETIEKIGHH
jgi:hypothetical protein